MVNRHYTIRHGAVDRTTDIETVPFKVLSNALNSVKILDDVFQGLVVN